MDTKADDALESLDLAWGCVEISKVIQRKPRQTFYILEKGLIPAAKKVGGRWVAERSKLREFFLAGADDEPTP